ncbi:hypothetical protein [Salinispira pacifica]
MKRGQAPAGDNGIGLLRESSLHAAMKSYLARPLDRFEERVGSHVIDIVRDNCLIEVQTASFAKLKPKLAALLALHPVRVVFPVAVEKWIVHVDAAGRELRRRRSPRRGRLEDLLRELTQIIDFVPNRHLSVEAILVGVEEIRRDDGKGSWRRRGVSIVDRRLLDVRERVLFSGPADYLRFLPGTLPPLFTNGDLAELAGRKRREAQTITYCLRRMGLLETAGKRGREIEYRRAGAVASARAGRKR